MTDQDLTVVERFRLDAMREFYAHPAGTWVRYSDYEALSAALEAERAELAGLKDAYTGAMEDKRMWKRRAEAAESRADAAQKDAEEWARKCAVADHRAEAAEAKLKEAADMLRDAIKYWVAVDPDAAESVEVVSMRAFLASLEGDKP